VIDAFCLGFLVASVAISPAFRFNDILDVSEDGEGNDAGSIFWSYAKYMSRL
jgi:hypothetical protein